MVQGFIVDIGLPVVERWERCARAMWSLSLGRNSPVPPPYPTQTVPSSFPVGSSTFVYHGQSFDAKPTAHVIADDYESDTDEWTPAELKTLEFMEKCASLETDLETVYAQLSAAEEALNESLAREAILRTQLDAAQTPIRRQMSRHPSPFPQTPTTPSRPSAYRSAITSPRVYRPAQPLSHIDSPSRFQNTGSSPLPAPHVEALANYYNYLNEHDLSGFIPSLDTLWKSVPISSWYEQLKQLDIPEDKIDTVMCLMAVTTWFFQNLSTLDLPINLFLTPVLLHAYQFTASWQELS